MQDFNMLYNGVACFPDINQYSIPEKKNTYQFTSAHLPFQSLENVCGWVTPYFQEVVGNPLGTYKYTGQKI